MKKKAIPPFSLTAGQSGRLLFDFTLPEGTAKPNLRGALMVHGQKVDMQTGDDDSLTIPPLPAGVYLAEVRAAGMCVLYGHVEVLPSPLSGEDGLATYRVDVDNTTDVLQVNITMLEGLTGPQGLSAYDVARQNGFEGAESEWLESLKTDAAVYAAKVVESYLGQARQAAADALNAQVLAEAAAIQAIAGGSQNAAM